MGGDLLVCLWFVSILKPMIHDGKAKQRVTLFRTNNKWSGKVRLCDLLSCPDIQTHRYQGERMTTTTMTPRCVGSLNNRIDD